jgi:hypothetical protein
MLKRAPLGVTHAAALAPLGVTLGRTHLVLLHVTIMDSKENSSKRVSTENYSTALHSKHPVRLLSSPIPPPHLPTLPPPCCTGADPILMVACLDRDKTWKHPTRLG